VLLVVQPTLLLSVQAAKEELQPRVVLEVILFFLRLHQPVEVAGEVGQAVPIQPQPLEVVVAVALMVMV
jgi:hypothetical protein